VRLIAVSPEAFADAAVDALRRALAGTERPCVGLPTGATPIPLYRRMREVGFTFPSGCHAFALDEYLSPDAEHPRTNAAYFREHWPGVSAGVPRLTVPHCDASDPEAEIAAYCAEIAAAGGFDVVLLGIGANGHIAFNEPGSLRNSMCRVVTLADETRRAAAATWKQLPTEAYTVGVSEIMAARHVILLATGASKRRVLHSALTGPVTHDLPASFLQEHADLTVVCDTEAWIGAPIC